MRHKKSLRATALLGREAGVRLSREPHFNEDQPRRIRALAAATQTPARAPQIQPRPVLRGHLQQPATDNPAATRDRCVFYLGWGRSGQAPRCHLTAALVALARVDPTGRPPPRPPFLERRLPGAGQSGPARRRCVPAAPGLLAPASFVWCHPALNRESGKLGPPGFPLPCCWRWRVRAEELGEVLVIVRTGCGARTKWSRKEWLGLASYCVCVPECPGEWHVPGDGGCSVGVASTFFAWSQVPLGTARQPRVRISTCSAKSMQRGKGIFFLGGAHTQRRIAPQKRLLLKTRFCEASPLDLARKC